MKHGQDQEQNEPQGGHNGNNGRNYAPRPFIQPDDPFMLLEEFALPPTVVQSAIRRPPIHANNFELKAMTLQRLQNILFHGFSGENPTMHLTTFIEVCDTIKYNGLTKEALRLRLFLFSLGDRAKHWLTSQPPDSITSWNDFVQKFLTKFFLPVKIAQLMQEINTFRQLEGENLAEAWEIFHELLRRCPHHRLTRWMQVHSFYNGLRDATRTVIDASTKISQLVQEINTFRQLEGENLAEAWERFHELLRRCPHHRLTRWMQVHSFYNGLRDATRTVIDASAKGAVMKKTTDQAYGIL